MTLRLAFALAILMFVPAVAWADALPHMPRGCTEQSCPVQWATYYTARSKWIGDRVNQLRQEAEIDACLAGVRDVAVDRSCYVTFTKEPMP